MPLYEYQCKKCGFVFEQIQKFSDPEVRKCPQCKGAVERLLSAPAVQFKGTGWYATDYAKKGSPSASGGDSESSASKPKEKSEKPEKKAEKKK